MTASADNSSRFGVHLSRHDVAPPKSSAIKEATNLGLVHFDYSPAWNGGHSPPIGSIGGCWMTSPNCTPSFESWQPVHRTTERGLPLSVVSKRLAMLERRAEALLFATSTCSNEPNASRLKLISLKRRCRVTVAHRKPTARERPACVGRRPCKSGPPRSRTCLSKISAELVHTDRSRS
jgi:hypothetical protein